MNNYLKSKHHNAEFLTSHELKRLKFKSCGKNVKIHTSCVIVNPQNIIIGDNVRIDAFTYLSASTSITIGSHVHIGAHCSLLGAGHIELKDYSGLSGRVSIYSTTDDESGNHLVGATIDDEFKCLYIKPVIIEMLSIVFCGCIILPGCHLREGAILGANSLLLENTELNSYTISAGSPAKFIKSRNKGCAHLVYLHDIKYNEGE